MATCPDGHDSVSQDYCDICGMRISGAPPPAAGPRTAGPGTAAARVSSARPGDEVCPNCRAPKSSGQFCEACGLNFSTGVPAPTPASRSVSAPAGPAPVTAPIPSLSTPLPTTAASVIRPSGATAPPVSTRAMWTAVVAADRVYYDLMQAASGGDSVEIPFPSYCPERRFQLAGAEMRIGRRSPSRGLEPEIDLTGPPTDPGISRLHAVLIATTDGWAILDPGSANGTQVNGTDMPTNQQIPLRDGDRISLGAWTTITVHSG